MPCNIDCYRLYNGHVVMPATLKAGASPGKRHPTIMGALGPWGWAHNSKMLVPLLQCFGKLYSLSQSPYSIHLLVLCCIVSIILYSVLQRRLSLIKRFGQSSGKLLEHSMTEHGMTEHDTTWHDRTEHDNTTEHLMTEHLTTEHGIA